MYIFVDWYSYAKENYIVVPEELEYPMLRLNNGNLPFDKNKGEVAVIGSDFSYGRFVETEETLAYKLQKLTNRHVYNLANINKTLNQVLCQVEYYIFGEKKISPKYYVLVLSSEDIDSMYTRIQHVLLNTEKLIKYKKMGKELEMENLTIGYFDSLFCSKLYQKIHKLYLKCISDNKKFDLLKLYLLAMKNSMKTSEFIVVFYPDSIKTNRLSELEKDGITVIDLTDEKNAFLKDEKYKDSQEHMYPNELAWDYIADLIVKKSGM